MRCKAWRKQTSYQQPDDYVFASERLRGRKPIALKEVFVKNIRLIIEQLGFAEAGSQYGWHAFRHGVGTALWELTKDKLTVRDLLRHSVDHHLRTLYARSRSQDDRGAGQAGRGDWAQTTTTAAQTSGEDSTYAEQPGA
jgi:hypothetical protein